MWFSRGKCEIPRKALLVWSDDSVHLESLLECGGFLRRRAHSLVITASVIRNRPGPH